MTKNLDSSGAAKEIIEENHSVKKYRLVLLIRYRVNFS